MSEDIKIVANTIDPEEMRVAIVENGRLRELFIERMWERQKTGEIYKARVESVLPGINASFVSLGDGRNAFLYLNDAKGLDLKPNSEVVVQVVKTARKNKGARVTARISLPGRYLVLVPGGKETGVSKRIEDEDERQRLRGLAKELHIEGLGIIVRTAAEGVAKDVLQADLEDLVSLWKEIEHNARIQSAPCLIYKDLGLVGRVLRDELTEDVSEIVADGEEEYSRILEHMPRFCKGKLPEVSFYHGSIPVFEFYDLEKEVENILDHKVWLKSGAYLVIDQTEALTVIDVNTGKYVGHTDLRHTVLETNLEAAEEIAWQLCLRAIGGIVVVDFIDMEYEEDRKQLINRLENLFQNDRCRARIFGITQLGLVEITRKRARPDIRSILTRSCPFCSDCGAVLKEDSVAVAIKRFLRKVILSNKSEALFLEANRTIAAYIADLYLSSWEAEFGRRIFIRGMPEFAWDKYRLDFQGALEAVEYRIEQGKDREEGTVVHSTSAS